MVMKKDDGGKKRRKADSGGREGINRSARDLLVTVDPTGDQTG